MSADIQNISALWTSFTQNGDGSSEICQWDELAKVLLIDGKQIHTLMRHRSIVQFHKWQTEFAEKAMSFADRNILLSVSTSAGKTLAAELLALHVMFHRSKDVILVFPFVSIAREKVESMVQLSNDLDFCLEEYAAGKGSIPPKKRRGRPSMFVCTFEKADLLIDSLINDGKMSDRIGLIVVDEIHMIGEMGGRMH